VSILSVKNPRICYSHALGVCAEGHAAVEAGEAVGAVEFAAPHWGLRPSTQS
jgi:hypothetical protein